MLYTQDDFTKMLPGIDHGISIDLPAIINLGIRRIPVNGKRISTRRSVGNRNLRAIEDLEAITGRVTNEGLGNIFSKF